MSDAIIQGLEMSEEEQSIRMASLKQTVMKFDIKHWVKIFMDQLSEVKKTEKSRRARHVNKGLVAEFSKRMRAAKKRALFLDYDGTLVGFKSNIDDASPDAELYQLINKLVSDDRNQVIIISGRKHETLEQWFGHLRKVDLIAEHGAWKKNGANQWIETPNLSDKWKVNVRPMLESYSDRTPGSFIEEKRYALAWHYRKVEEGLGELRANELVSNMRYLTREMGLQLLPGNKVLEIKTSDINKGKATLEYLNGKSFDFIIAMGDDHTDEDIFTAINDIAITIKVGSSISEANYYLRNVQEVRNLLNNL